MLRPLEATDEAALASYFGNLSEDSKRRFQPHPLTAVAARDLCGAAGGPFRFVVEHLGGIVAYFILDPNLSDHEMGRYRECGIELSPGRDFLFAPSVLDTHQNAGLASLAMPHLMEHARRHGARSLVLMGGTQATNPRAIAFYEKFGFERFGGYQTDVFNHDMRRVL